jgi:hypothetical protein
MENQLPQRSNQSLEGINPKEIQIGEIVFDMNLFRSYPLSDNQIIDYAKYINRVMPDLELKYLRAVIDGMLQGKIEYNHNNGIQNIFKALKSAIGETLEDRQKRLTLENRGR